MEGGRGGEGEIDGGGGVEDTGSVQGPMKGGNMMLIPQLPQRGPFSPVKVRFNGVGP